MTADVTPEAKAEEREQLRTIFSAMAMMALIVRGSTSNEDVAICAVNHAEQLLTHLDQTKPKEKVG